MPLSLKALVPLCLAAAGLQFSFAFAGEDLGNSKFPDDFIFGVGTASHQVEGAWNEDGKGENNWDHYTHVSSPPTTDGSNADVACDSYHKYKEDVAILKELGVDSYRFSLSWSRILPKGYSNAVNPLGVAYYNNLINALLANGIAPMVTLFHMDLPWNLQQLGGWTNPLMAEYYADYARVAFENFGDRVKIWLTINEPRVLCMKGYGGVSAPGLKASGIADYLCGHHTLKAHALVYHIYHHEYKSKQGGRIGITLDEFWYQPASNSSEDIEAAERRKQFSLGWFAHPIFTEAGDYPEVMKSFVAAASAAQGFPRSRLPVFTPEEIDLIRGSSDFMALNFYSSYLLKATKEQEKEPSFTGDSLTMAFQREAWPKSTANWIKNTPWGLRKMLKYVKENYNSPEVIITENGFADHGELCDVGRYHYIQDHLQAALESIHLDKVNLTGYYAWSLIDDFEWIHGYSIKFGLYHVDFAHPGRARTPKLSASLYKDIVKRRVLVRKNVNKTMCAGSNIRSPMGIISMVFLLVVLYV